MNARRRYFVGGVDLAPLPKVSLHDHLDGALRPQTVLDLADGIGHPLPATTPEELGAWFLTAASGGELATYLQAFAHTVAVMQTEEGLERVAREYVHDLVDDGVVYAEVRWAPEQHTDRGLTMDRAVEAVAAGLAQGVAEAARVGRDVVVSQILCAMRQTTTSMEVARLAVRHRADGVVGFDIAGPEQGYPASLHAPAFDYLASRFLPVTVHAGEEGDLSSIRSALVDGRALRLGHAVRLLEDISVGEDDEPQLGDVASWVRDRAIALECCPSSNLQTAGMRDLGDRIEDHPFDLYYSLGMRVTVNPDNRLMSGTSVTRELGLLCDAFDYDLADVAVFELNAADAAFLPLDAREDLADRIEAGFDAAGA